MEAEPPRSWKGGTGIETVFRALRMDCRISLKELANIAQISHQRLSQIELRRFGSLPRDQERLITALEQLIQQRKKALERAESICKNERAALFHDTGREEKS